MTPKSRAPRGSVSVYSSGGFLRLNYKPKGRPRQRRALGLADTPQNRAIAQSIAAKIDLDLALNQYKGDLGYYVGNAPEQLTTAGLFGQWIDYLVQCNTPLATINSRYRDLESNLTQWGREIATTEQAAAFLKSMSQRQEPATTNVYLGLLKRWGIWCCDRGHWQSNPFEPIRPFPGAKSAAAGEPFSPDEVARILETMAAGAYAHYVDFTYFLLATGVRPGEAIALRWENVDLAAGTVTIAESLTRSKGGKRQRKKPKTGDKGIRTLPLTEELKTVLRGRRPPYCHPNRLVFPGPKGKAIHDNNFRNRCWLKTLQAAGVPYRKPYFTRHTFASWAIAQGSTLPDTAKLLGHVNSRMVQQTYGRSTGQITMPTVPAPGHRSRISHAAKVVSLES